MRVVVTYRRDWCQGNRLVLLLTLCALRAAATPGRRWLPPPWAAQGRDCVFSQGLVLEVTSLSRRVCLLKTWTETDKWPPT